MHFYAQITEFGKKCWIGRQWKRFGQENATLHSAIESGESTARAQFHVQNVPTREQRDVEFRNWVAWQIGRHDNISPYFREDFRLVFVYFVRQTGLRACLRSSSLSSSAVPMLAPKPSPRWPTPRRGGGHARHLRAAT